MWTPLVLLLWTDIPLQSLPSCFWCLDYHSTNSPLTSTNGPPWFLHFTNHLQFRIPFLPYHRPLISLPWPPYSLHPFSFYHPILCLLQPGIACIYTLPSLLPYFLLSFFIQITRLCRPTSWNIRAEIPNSAFCEIMGYTAFRCNQQSKWNFISKNKTERCIVMLPASTTQLQRMSSK